MRKLILFTIMLCIGVAMTARNVTVSAVSKPAATALRLELQKAIAKLPEKQRLVFNMKYFDEMKYEEISDILGTSVGALKASYHHAVKKITEAISAIEM